MKLSTRYNQINLISSVVIFLLASIAFYTLLRYVLIRQVDDDLEIERDEIEGYVAKYGKLPEEEPVGDQQIIFTAVDSAGGASGAANGDGDSARRGNVGAVGADPAAGGGAADGDGFRHEHHGMHDGDGDGRRRHGDGHGGHEGSGHDGGYGDAHPRPEGSQGGDKGRRGRSRFITIWDGDGFRKLEFIVTVSDGRYKASVSKSLRASNRVTQSIVLITLSTIFCMLIAGFLINRLILRRLWLPFYQSLAAMQAYRIGQSRPAFSPTRIDEFHSLNQTLEESVQHAESEYGRLKEFTENAAHELQTPLAIIRSKLDVLIQDKHLSADQSHIVQGVYDAVNRLARLNKSLLLLSKIENGQFSDKSTFNLREVVENKLDSFKELWEEKQIRLDLALADRVVAMNPALAEVLLNNLLSNAIRHIPAGGVIRIGLTAEKLTIANSAAGGPLDSFKLFSRFYKGGQSSDNQGLGLSIVQQVGIASGFRIEYRFENGEHMFEVIF